MAATTAHAPELPALVQQLPGQQSSCNQTSTYTYSMIKSQGRQRPTVKYISRTERKKKSKPRTICYNAQGWIHCMASKDEPRIVTGSWKTFSQCTDVGKKIANLWGFMRKLHIEDVFKSHFVSGIVSPILSSSAPFEESQKVREGHWGGLRAWKMLSKSDGREWLLLERRMKKKTG